MIINTKVLCKCIRAMPRQNPSLGFPTRSNTNQNQERARALKILDLRSRGIVLHVCSENKDAVTAKLICA